MKKVILFAITLFFSFSILAQQKVIYDENIEKRNVSGFNAIAISDGIDLYLIPATEESVAVSATETQYRNRIVTEVKNNILYISYNNPHISWMVGNKKMRAYVGFKTLIKLKASGASDVFVSEVLKTPDLVIELSGSSDFKGVVNIDNLQTTISGASDMSISGQVQSLNIQASGASDFKGYNLAVQICNASASGASDIKVTVDNELTATASGASDIRIKGKCIIKQTNSRGSSSIKKL